MIELSGSNDDLMDLAGDEMLAGDDFLAGDDLMSALSGDGDEFSGEDVDQLLRAMAGAGALGRRRGVRGAGGQAANLMQRIKGAALASKMAQHGTLVRHRAPTKSREYPLGFTSAAPIAAGATASVQQQPQVPFKLERLVVPSDVAGLFDILDVKVGKNSQFAADSAVPARVFQENGVGVRLSGDTAQISQIVSIRVQNISGAPATFRAAIIGSAVE